MRNKEEYFGNQMNCRKVKNLLPFYLAPHESWLDPKTRTAVAAHMEDCESCRLDYEVSCKALRILQNQVEICEDTHALLDRSTLPYKLKAVIPPWTNRLASMGSAAAAVILICLGIGWVLIDRLDSWNQKLALSNVPTDPILEAILVTENAVSVPYANRLTTGQGIRRLIINNQHSLFMNRNTTLAIHPLVTEGRQGCLIELYSGQILVHVIQNGKPFEVHSRHGRAVITGTTFDVRVTEKETALVVVEGSVRFESTTGTVQVAGGYKSLMKAGANPINPLECNVRSLTAWAAGHEADLPFPVSPEELEWGCNVEEPYLPAFFPAPPLELVSVDYHLWIESRRAWFAEQYPWIFEMQRELAKRVKEPLAITRSSESPVAVPDYPELLFASGDIWQINAPLCFSRLIPVFQPDRFQKLASRYGLDEQWVRQKISSVAYRESAANSSVSGEQALMQWVALVRDAETTCDRIVSGKDLCDYAFGMGSYLENVRTLAWLGVRNETVSVPEGQKIILLDLLHKQVQSIYECKQTALHIVQVRASSGGSEIEKLQRMTHTITVFAEAEGQIRSILSQKQ